MELKLNSIQHIGIPVTNILISEKFYSKLGFTNAMKASFIMDEKKGTCIMMKRGEMIIELYQMPDHKLQAISNRKDGHIDHVAFDVDDVEKTFELMQKEGFKILEEKPVFLDFWTKGCKYFNILGPDGERIEFNQILK